MADTDAKVDEMKRYLSQENLDVLVDQLKQYITSKKQIFFYPNKANFPETGKVSILYVSRDTLSMFTWNGDKSIYEELKPADVIYNNDHVILDCGDGLTAFTTVVENE